MKRAILISLTLLLAAATSRAAHYADVYVIPVASHVPGANGTNWMSDIAIHNFQTTPLSVELVLIESGFDTSDNVVPVSTITPLTIPAGGTRIAKDFLAGMPRPSSSVGAVVVGGDKAFAVTSRSYSMSPAGDTVGQTVLASRDFLTESLLDSMTNGAAYLPGLISNAKFRTNLGFAAGAGVASPLVFEIIVLGSEGTQLGLGQFTVPAGSVMHRQFSIRTLAAADFDAGSVRVRIDSGDGAVVPYASVIDNNTADAVFVSGQFPPNTAFAQSLVPSVFEQILLRYRSSNR